MSSCRTCTNKKINVTRAEGDLARAKGLLRRNGNRYDGRYVTQVATARAVLEEAQASLHDHADEAHDGQVVEPEKKIGSGGWGNRIFKPAAEIPEGKSKCHACGKVVSVVGGTHLRRHSKGGEPCPNIQLAERRQLIYTVPEVQIVPRGRPSGTSPAPRRGRSEPSRLDVGSSCRECGKWLPGERSLCGRCFANQERPR